MAARFDSGGRRPRDWEVGVDLIRAGDRVAHVRRRLLLGEYDSDQVVREVARRVLACGVITGREENETAPWRRHN